MRATQRPLPGITGARSAPPEQGGIELLDFAARTDPSHGTKGLEAPMTAFNRTPADARVGIVGLGYVGLPLAVEFGHKLPTVGLYLGDQIQSRLWVGEFGQRGVRPIDWRIFHPELGWSVPHNNLIEKWV